MTRDSIKCWCIIVYLIIFGGLIYGCAGGQFTPQAQQNVSNAVAQAKGLLWNLDLFYSDLVALKAIPDKTTKATQALAVADAAAAAIDRIVKGSPATDIELNVIAGQVAGAKAILQETK